MDRIFPLLKSSVIHSEIQKLGASITEHYEEEGVDEVVAVCVMNGAFMFFSDLVKCLKLPKVYCEFIRVSSYEGTSSTGNVSISYDVNGDLLKGRHVLIIEDIFDTGNTLKFLTEHFHSYEPQSVKVCCLLHKEGNAVHNVSIDYTGFVIDKNEFVVGYGLDYDGLYRNIPFIGSVF